MTTSSGGNNPAPGILSGKGGDDAILEALAAGGDIIIRPSGEEMGFPTSSKDGYAANADLSAIDIHLVHKPKRRSVYETKVSRQAERGKGESRCPNECDFQIVFSSPPARPPPPPQHSLSPPFRSLTSPPHPLHAL
jgi:hypothetical protein